MKITGPGTLLRIYVGESDRWEGQPLYEALLLRARAMGLAGATVLRGHAGFGAHSRLHTAKVLRLTEDLPILIEIVDREERIREFLPACDAMIGEGLVTLEKVEILKYQANAPRAGR
jgi:PII-like signaling protein